MVHGCDSPFRCLHSLFGLPCALSTHRTGAATRAAAAACATIDLYEREQLFARAAQMAPVFEREIHELKDARHVIDVPIPAWSAASR